jgi:methylenetetrahydrofolate dehydrogenase (NADP+)/methenyltetrahydrofolate cyclohydrolase
MAAMIVSEKKSAEMLDGRIVADAIKREVADEVRHLRASAGIKPTLAAVLVGEDPASAVYVRNKVRACEEVGIASRKIELADSISTDELLGVVTKLNQDDEVDGILVQLPLPKQIDDSRIIQAIDPAKDVDAFHPTNVGLLAMGPRSRSLHAGRNH